MNKKSIIVPLGMEELDVKRVLNAIEEFGSVIALDKKETNIIRLISEELLGIASAIFEVTEGRFWAEVNEGTVEVHIKTATSMSDGTKEEINKLSANGNVAYKGMAGLLRRVVDIMKESMSVANPVLLSEGTVAAEMTSGYIYTSPTMENALEWNLQKCEELMRLDEKAENWDELELSVLKKLSDNIIVGYRAEGVDITVISKITA